MWWFFLENYEINKAYIIDLLVDLIKTLRIVLKLKSVGSY